MKLNPRALIQGGPDPEELARDLARLEQQWKVADHDEARQSVLRDQLSLLASRCQWIADAQKRTFLDDRARTLWQQQGLPP
jgi:MoxR-like ATPase